MLFVVHLGLVGNRRKHLTLCAIAALIGLGVETALMGAGVFQFASGHPVPQLPPPWIVLMWIQFATLFPFGLSWLCRRYLLAAVLGLMGAPLAFLTGERIGAVTFLPPRLAHLALLALFWAAAMPLLVYATDWLFGFTRVRCSYSRLSDP